MCSSLAKKICEREGGATTSRRKRYIKFRTYIHTLCLPPPSFSVIHTYAEREKKDKKPEKNQIKIEKKNRNKKKSNAKKF